jgi:hypothetical protein
VRFLVYGDGKLLKRSAPIGFGEAAAPMAVDLAGVGILELVVKSEGDGAAPVAVTWAEAALSR